MHHQWQAPVFPAQRLHRKPVYVPEEPVHIRVNLDHIVIALFLLLQNFKSFLCISGSDHAIGYFSLDQKCCIFVAHIRKEMKSPKEDILSAPLALA